MPRVDILLATYNGAEYLPQQLASIEAQTHTDWRLIVRDDGSSDDSLNIIRRWAETAQHALVIIEDGKTRQGHAKSFGRLLEESDAPYFAYCDQDDYWKTTKLERLLYDIRTLEAEHGTDNPLLVHCDLEIVEADLKPSGRQFWDQMQIVSVNVDSAGSNAQARASLLLQNVVTGCAMLGNAELRRRAAPHPDGVYVHDWWVALIAGYFGAVHAVPEPLVKYRQHGANAIGAKSWDMPSMLKRFLLNPTGTVRKTILLIENAQMQANAFYQTFGDQLSEADRNVVREFSVLSEKGYFTRKSFMLRHHLYPKSWTRRLVLFCLI